MEGKTTVAELLEREAALAIEEEQGKSELLKIRLGNVEAKSERETSFAKIIGKAEIGA